MEENEIIYIPYGQDEISQQDLMTSLANGVESYLGSKRWAKKDKYRQAWLDAYQNIINRGITGASNDSGIWKINHKGDNFTLDTMSNTEREMYQDAAYYIQQKMAQMTPRKKEEEKKKEDLEKYGNFGTNLMNQILKGYGNNSELFKDSEQGWDAQDARGTDGLRGTEHRKAAMIKALSDYRDSLNDKNFNFEGTSFKDKADLQTKIQAAIDALGTDKETDDLPAFNALGLPYRAFFNNGGNDPYTKGDYTGTYSGYNEYLAEQNKAKQKAEQEKLKQQRANQWKSFRSWDFSKLAGRPLTSEESNSTYLDNLFAKGKWTADEQSQIVSAFKLAEQNNQLVGLSKEELAKLPSTWKNRGKYLKRINGLKTPFYYDTLSKQFKLFNNGDLNTKISFQEVLDKNTPEAITKKKVDADQKLREQYEKRTEMTPQDWEYVASIVPDIASIPDTEPISAAALAFTGAGMRHHALANRPGGMSASDKWWQAADYLGAGLAAVPGFGDAYLVGRILNTTRKFATGLFAAAGAYGLGSATVNAFGKWARGEDMTLQEKMDVVMAIPSLVSAYRLRSREGLNDAAKAANQNNITTNKGKVKVTITDESGNKSVKEITGLSEQKSKELQKQFKNAGNDNSKKTQILKSDSEVQTKASEQGIDLNKVSIETDSRYMASHRKPTEIEFYQETSPSSARTRYNQEIENLKNSGHNWQARRLQIYDKFYKGTGGAKKESNGNWFKKAWHYVTDTPNQEFANRIKNGETSKPSTETSKTTGKRTWAEIEKKPKKWSQSAEAKEYKEMLKGNYSNNAIQGGTHKIGDLTINVDIPRPGATNGFAEITFSNGNKQTIRFDSQKQLQEQIAKIVKERRVQIDSSGKKTKVDIKEMSKILKSLKARGFLKQGGTINNPYIDNVIEDFFKNNNI